MNKIDISIEAIYRKKLNLIKALDDLKDSIKELVENAGGFINLANNDGQHDNVYGAIYNFSGGGELVEVMIKGIKVVKGEIYCYCVPITTCRIEYTKEDMLEDEEGWEWLNISSDLMYAYTLHMLADVFEFGEYVNYSNLKDGACKTIV